MSTTAPLKKVASAAPKPLPLVVHFQGDEAALRSLDGMNKYRRIAFHDLDRVVDEVEQVVIVTREEQLKSNYEALRKPQVRVIALSDDRFKDARLDGAVYSYLPERTPKPIVERMVDNALDHIQLLANRKEITDRLNGATREIRDLNQIGAALSAEHDTAKLLEMILTKSREITQSDAGSLYLVEQEDIDESPETHHGEELKRGGVVTDLIPAESGSDARIIMRAEGKKRLRFKLAQNDSVVIPFRERVMEISEKSIAGYVALTGRAVNIEDAYHMPPDVPYSINRKFDEDWGYRTKSIVAAPMKNHNDEILGLP